MQQESFHSSFSRFKVLLLLVQRMCRLHRLILGPSPASASASCSPRQSGSQPLHQSHQVGTARRALPKRPVTIQRCSKWRCVLVSPLPRKPHRTQSKVPEGAIAGWLEAKERKLASRNEKRNTGSRRLPRPRDGRVPTRGRL